MFFIKLNLITIDLNLLLFSSGGFPLPSFTWQPEQLTLLNTGPSPSKLFTELGAGVHDLLNKCRPPVNSLILFKFKEGIGAAKASLFSLETDIDLSIEIVSAKLCFKLKKIINVINIFTILL